MRRIVWMAAVAVGMGLGAAAWGQGGGAADGASADAGGLFAAYDVVMVKPAATGGKMIFMGVRATPDGIDGENVTVAMLVRSAYGGFMKLPTDDSVTGLPDWAKTEFFSVQAKMNAEQAAEFAKLDKDAQEDRREAMMRALLADRFQLKVHRETKTVQDYELVVAKGGPKMKESGSAGAAAAGGPPPPPGAPTTPDGKPITGGFLMMSGGGKVRAQAFTMTQLANFLGQPPVGLGRMVKDKTGLTAKYDFTMTFQMAQGFGGPMGGPGPPPPAGATADDPQASIFTALQEELGLKLQPSTGTIDTVVVEHVERPSAD